MSDDERSRLAYAIQGIMANELWADPDFDVNGTGPASFKIADLLLSNARNAALEEAAKVADAAQDMRERLFRENGASLNASKAVQAERIAADIRRLKAEGESR